MRLAPLPYLNSSPAGPAPPLASVCELNLSPSITLRYSPAPVEDQPRKFSTARFLGWAFAVFSLFQIFLWVGLLLWSPIFALSALVVQSLVLLRVGRWLRHPAREGKRERTMWLLCALSQGLWLAWLANPQIEYHGFPALLISALIPLVIGASALFLAIRRPRL